MNLQGQYVQYSKLFVSVFGLAYIVHVAATLILICRYPEQSEAFLQTLEKTTSLFGIVFSCYTGNSAVEKYIVNKSQVSAALGNAEKKASEG